MRLLAKYYKKFQNSLILLLVLGIVLPSILLIQPKKAEAAWWSTWLTDINTSFTSVSTGTSAVANTTSTAVALKNVAKEITRQVFMTVARRFLQEMTKSTINWINTGNFGNPLFVENPKSFFKDIAKYEIRNLVNVFGYDSKKYPFGKDFALNVINAYNSQLATNAEYTLNRVINDPYLLREYRTNFNVGGWNGFITNTQYPQNNYIGFNMMATEALARKLDGTYQNEAQKVQKALDQGMGFLSPQTCPSNPHYNTIGNQFRRPSFNQAEYERTHPAPKFSEVTQVEAEDGTLVEDPGSLQAYNDRVGKWQRDLNNAKGEWQMKNTCPDGLVSTTPGSVVASQITNAMGSQFRQSELAAAMGNSISAIVDSLMNKFIGKGLNALATKVSPRPANDAWSYMGLTLGSPGSEGGINVAWNSGPDEEINLDKFKREVDDGIANTTLEMKLISNESATEPGIFQLIGSIWPKTRDLDMCIPGPNLNWEKRLEEEMVRNSKTLAGKVNDNNGNTAAQADLALRELRFAVSFFKDWINIKMLTELPSSILYMDAISELEDLDQESTETKNRLRSKQQTLARLQALKNGLANFTVQPAPGSGQERALIELRKQFMSIFPSISNTASVEDSRTQLNILKDKFAKLTQLADICEDERLTKGWTNPGGRSSTYKDQGTEQNLFCDFPIKGGYVHDTFKNTTGTHPEIPLVNAKNVLRWPRVGGLFGTHEAHVQLNCNIIYTGTVLDYKQDFPGTTIIVEPYINPESDSDDPVGDPAENDPGEPTGWVWLDRGGAPFQSSVCPSISPRDYFMSLLGNRDVSEWQQVMNDIEPGLWACGIGQQRTSGGEVRGRLFLPTAACPNAAPSGGDAFLGVKQDPACWEHPVDVVE